MTTYNPPVAVLSRIAPSKWSLSRSRYCIFIPRAALNIFVIPYAASILNPIPHPAKLRLDLLVRVFLKYLGLLSFQTTFLITLFLLLIRKKEAKAKTSLTAYQLEYVLRVTFCNVQGFINCPLSYIVSRYANSKTHSRSTEHTNYYEPESHEALDMTLEAWTLQILIKRFL